MRETQSVQTFFELAEEVTRDAGFLMMTYGSILDMEDCYVAHSQGNMAGALFALGRNKINIRDSKIYDNISNKAGTITIEGATECNIHDTELQLNRGGPDLRVLNSNITLHNILFGKNYDASFIRATNTNILVEDSRFVKGGNNNTLGGAIYCDCNNATIINNKFQ